MKTGRVIAVASIIAAACASSIEQGAAPQAQAQDAGETFAALHAAIPASRESGNVFEYSTVVPVSVENVTVVDRNDKYFDYN